MPKYASAILHAVLLIYFFTCCSAIAQIAGPNDYTQASQNLTEFFVLSSNHQPVRPTDDFGKFWGTYTQSNHWQESYSKEYGVSLQMIPINSRIRSSFLVFDIPDGDIPKTIYVPRFHFMYGLRQNLAVGFNLLYYPDWATYGMGVTGDYTFIRFGHFYTGLLLNYGGAWKNNFMALNSGSVSITETYAIKGFEIYAGLKYVNGRANFEPPPNQVSFGTINFENQLGTSYLFGVSFSLLNYLGLWDETLTFTGQIDIEKDMEPNLLAKIAFKIPSHRTYSKRLGKTQP